MVVRSFRAHHQGMSLLSLAYLLLNRPMQRRFESDPFTLDKPIALKAKNTFKVLGKANKVDIVDKDDKTVSTQAASGVAFTLTVKWSGKRWMLDSLTQG